VTDPTDREKQLHQVSYDMGRVAAAHEIRDRILALDKRYQANEVWLGTKHDLLRVAANVAIKYAGEVASGSTSGQPESDPGCVRPLVAGTRAARGRG
jgi:hypothetical protein